MARVRLVSTAGTLQLTRRGWFFVGAALSCAIVAYGSGRAEFLYGACFLTVLPVAAIVLVRARRPGLGVVRTFSPTVVPAGSRVTAELQVRNTARSASSPAIWLDRIPWGDGTAGGGALPALAPSAIGHSMPASRTQLSYQLTPLARGVVEVGPLEVEYVDPFGIAFGRVSLGGTQPLVVTPAISDFSEGGPSFIAGEGSARLVQRNVTGNDDDLMTRQYRSGDALRRVHWRASARHGELMVRQEEQRTYPEARLLIDTMPDGYRYEWSDAGGQQRALDAFEWAVRMIASLGVHLHKAGFRVQVLETSTAQIQPLGEVSQGSGQEIDFLVSLAGVSLLEPPSSATWADRRDERAQNAQGPVFAIVADPRPDTLRWIAGQRRPYEIGVAFVIGWRSAAALATLQDAGWTCVAVSETDDPALAWASVPGQVAAPVWEPSGTFRGSDA